MRSPRSPFCCRDCRVWRCSKALCTATGAVTLDVSSEWDRATGLPRDPLHRSRSCWYVRHFRRGVCSVHDRTRSEALWLTAAAHCVWLGWWWEQERIEMSHPGLVPITLPYICSRSLHGKSSVHSDAARWRKSQLARKEILTATFRAQTTHQRPWLPEHTTTEQVCAARRYVFVRGRRRWTVTKRVQSRQVRDGTTTTSSVQHLVRGAHTRSGLRHKSSHALTAAIACTGAQRPLRTQVQNGKSSELAETCCSSGRSTVRQ